LEKGQKLFQCGRCRGPVPSPIPSQLLYGENSTVVTPTKQNKLRSTRLKVNSAMRNLFKRSPTKPERKKTKIGEVSSVEGAKNLYPDIDDPKRSSIKSSNTSTADIDLPSNTSFHQRSIVRKLNWSDFSDRIDDVSFANIESLEFNDEFTDSGICEPLELSTECRYPMDIANDANFIASPEAPEFSVRKSKRAIQHSSSSSDVSAEECGQQADTGSIALTQRPSDNGTVSKNTSGLFQQTSSQLHQNSTNSSLTSTRSVLREDSGGILFQSISPQHLENNFRSFEQSMNCLSLRDVEFQNHMLDISLDSISCPDLNESYVLECPKCTFRFCSTCNEMEHTGRPCRVVGSSFLSTSCDNIYDGNLQVLPTIKDSSASSKSNSFKGRSGSELEKKKRKSASLRRLARL